MSSTPGLGDLELDWLLSDAASSLATFDYNYPDMSPDGPDFMGLNMPGILDPNGHLASIPPGSLLHPSTITGSMTNATSYPSDFPHSTNTINQHPEASSDVQQEPAQRCMSCGLTGYSPAIPTSACISPNNGYHPLGMNNLGIPDDCNQFLPNDASTTLTGDVSKIRNVHKTSEPPQPKIFTCKWEGCTHKRNHFRRDVDLMRHVKNIHVSPRSYPCDVPECNMLFNRRDNLEAHARRVHQRL